MRDVADVEMLRQWEHPEIIYSGPHQLPHDFRELGEQEVEVCKVIFLFFADCGHVNTYTIHSLPCNMQAEARAQLQPGIEPATSNGCRNDEIVYRLKAVQGKCEYCETYSGDLTDGSLARNPFFLVHEEIVERCRQFEALKVHQEFEAHRQYIQLEKRRVIRRVEIQAAWDTFVLEIQEYQVREGIPPIDRAYSFDPYANSSALLRIPENPIQEDCACCKTGVGDLMRIIPCAHHFCLPCLREWFKITDSCPYCRHDFKLVRLPNLYDDNILFEDWQL